MAGGKQIIDGVRFDSSKEAEVYRMFKADPDIDIISFHPAFELFGTFVRNGKKIRGAKYTSDFLVKKNGIEYVVEVKSIRWEKDTAYRLRRKLFLKAYPEVNFIEYVFNRKKYEIKEY